MASLAEAEAFFAASPALSLESEVKSELAEFVASLGPSDRVVCVSSGGTTVPLERRCVRFLDNFSAGNRGAASTEYFLQAGYAVIFLNRRFSVQPFARELPSAAVVLDCLAPGPEQNQVHAKIGSAELLARAVHGRAEAAKAGRLLRLEFTTLFEYLQLLQLIAQALQPCGPRAMLYLAAAVSDFYIPWQSMVEHKIQSTGGPLNLRLQRVPKLLGLVRRHWAPEALVVSFKLETDLAILSDKADQALRKYQVHAVIANILETRRDQVVMFSKEGHTAINRGTEADIESLIVKHLEQLQEAYIAERCQKPATS
eukprot:jgi/Chlat1/8511/Chrsp80S07810